MSAYWTAAHGTGLALTEMEFRAFIEMYLEKTGQTEIYIEQFIDSIMYDEEPLIRSKYLGIINNSTKPEHVFYIKCAMTDTCDGTCLIPYFIKKEGNLVKNIPGTYEENKFVKNPDYVILDELRFDNAYIIFSDKELNSADTFQEKPYPDYDTLVQEFKDKLETYLPKDFDWNGHIGIVDYAEYA